MHTQNDKLIDLFESELKAGKSPSIDAYLDRLPELAQPALLLDLISLEIYYRLEQKQLVNESDYERFGEIATTHAREVISSGGTIETEFEKRTYEPSRRIGRYKLLQKIGEGGMGAVWMAEQEVPVKRRVALKLIKSELASKEILARFEAERQALAIMDHQNISKVLDAGTTEGGTPFFVMELVKGIPITRYCDENRLNIEERLRLFIPVCKAIQHAHQKGILHRDLKPSNVLVTHYDDTAVPKVIDFGLAKGISQNMRLTDRTLFTEFGKVVGTLQYMSPEQAGMNSLDVDTRADIYSLGVMLYELLTGSTPVDQNTIGSNEFFDVLEIIREKDPPRPSYRLSTSTEDATSKVSLDRRVSLSRLQQVLKGDLDWVVMKALEKDRMRRYQTADDFARDISNYLDGEAVIARPPSTLYQLQKFAAKNRGLVSSLAAIGLVLLAGIFGTSFGLLRANRKTDEAESLRIVAEAKTKEAEEATKKAIVSKALALSEKDRAIKNEKRAIEAERIASRESKRARDSEAVSKFQLANARFDAERAREATELLYEIPEEYRNTFEWRFCQRRFLGSDLTCRGHQNYIYKVAFSHDGKLIASASRDKTIKLWDSTTGEEVATLSGHQGSVGSVAFSPNGRELASAGSDGTVRLWDVSSGQQTGTLEGHQKLVASVAYSPDGNWLATASDDRTVKRWDALTFENVATLEGHTREVGNAVFSPDGNWIASASLDRTARVWDANTGEQVLTLKGHNQLVISVAFSPDGKQLASASMDEVKLWDTTSGREVQTLKGHNQFVHHVTFSPDGQHIATGGRDRTIRLWDAHTGLEVSSLTGHSNWVNGVAFSPDGSRLASASYDRTVKVWDVKTGQNINTIQAHKGPGTDVAFSADGNLLASSGFDGKAKLWDANTATELATFYDTSGRVHCVAISPDGTLIAVGGHGGAVRIWDIASRQEVATLPGHKGPVRKIDISSDGKLIASACDDRRIRIWNLETGNPVTSIASPGGPKSITFSPDGAMVAAAIENRKLCIWTIQDRQKVLVNQDAHTQNISDVAFSPDGKTLASTGDDQTIKLWNISTGNAISSLTGHSESVKSVSFNHDGSRLVSASWDKTVKLWNTQTGDEIMSLTGHAGPVLNATFSIDGKRIASIGNNGEIKLWDTSKNNRAEYLLSKSTFDPNWHFQLANRAMRKEHWFSSAFHFAWLLDDDPEDPRFHDGLNWSHQQLTSQFNKEGRDVTYSLSPFLRQSLERPRGHKIQEFDASMADQINGRTWERVVSPRDFQTSPLSTIDLNLMRDMVHQHPRGIYFNTLATAEYRMKNYKEAVEAALKSIKLMPEQEKGMQEPYPGDYAILAMSYFQSGQKEQANKYRIKLEAAMAQDAYKADNECISFAREVEVLFDRQE